MTDLAVKSWRLIRQFRHNKLENANFLLNLMKIVIFYKLLNKVDTVFRMGLDQKNMSPMIYTETDLVSTAQSLLDLLD